MLIRKESDPKKKRKKRDPYERNDLHKYQELPPDQNPPPMAADMYFRIVGYNARR